MKSSSLKLIDLGIDASKYRDALIHDWYLADQYKKHLEVFILKETQKERLFFNIKDGELFVKGKPYSVTWIQSPAFIRASEFEYVLVSLRYCKYLGRGYALVKALEGSAQFEPLEYK